MKDTIAETSAEADGEIILRQPENTDGAAIWKLVDECKPLDVNSMYCNLIQCDHFADTCVLAERNGDVLGWISGYIRPDEPDVLFVWQVAVSSRARGEGLGGRMLEEIVSRPNCSGVRRLQTTITRDNAASWGLFKKFADRVGAEIDSEPYFDREDHFDGRYKTEHMVTINLRDHLGVVA